MKTNFIKIAWRQLTRNKVYASINIVGLAIGIACGLVIYKIISYESGYDKFNSNYSQIYRVDQANWRFPEKVPVSGKARFIRSVRQFETNFRE